MKTKIFDGRTYAKKLEEEIKSKIGKLTTKPKLVSLLVGENLTPQKPARPPLKLLTKPSTSLLFIDNGSWYLVKSLDE